MIVRILTEGQYQMDDSQMQRLNEIDNQLVDVVAKGDGDGYQRLYGEMLNQVRSRGAAVPASELVASDIVLPAPDTSLDEAKRLFISEGLIPG